MPRMEENSRVSLVRKKAVILGFGVFHGEPGVGAGWLRTGTRVVHGIRTYTTLDQAVNAIMSDKDVGKRVGTYQVVAEHAFFCQNGDDCSECLSHTPIDPKTIDWSIVQDRVKF